MLNKRIIFRILTFVSLATLVVTLSACSNVKKIWQDNPANYQSNDGMVAPLNLPKSYTQNGKIRDYYPVPHLPKITKSKGSESVAKLIIPPGSGLKS